VGRTNYFILLSSVLFATTVFSQKKLLHGKITSENEIEGIHVLNTTSHFNAITDTYGNFSILVNLKDTLVFSSINYLPEKSVVTQEIYEKEILIIKLKELINELDEVFLGPNLSGNIATDLKNIKTKTDLNFDDVGIPGFKGKPEEKIIPAVYAAIPTSVNIEALYKHLSGYYKKLRLKRKWESENNAAAHIINQYTPSFFNEAYLIPENRLYDFILFCIETSSLQNDFKNQNFVGVLKIFELKSKAYLARLIETEE